MVQDVRGIHADLEASVFANLEVLAGIHIQTPLSEVIDVASAQITGFARHGILQQDFARRSIGVTRRQSGDGAHGLQVGSHSIRCPDDRGIPALRIRHTDVLVARVHGAGGRALVPLHMGVWKRINSFSVTSLLFAKKFRRKN